MADWGAMAGGGGSKGWLCWLGRARVVPTAAAEENTGQQNLQFQNKQETNYPPIYLHWFLCTQTDLVSCLELKLLITPYINQLNTFVTVLVFFYQVKTSK